MEVECLTKVEGKDVTEGFWVGVKEKERLRSRYLSEVEAKGVNSLAFRPTLLTQVQVLKNHLP